MKLFKVVCIFGGVGNLNSYKKGQTYLAKYNSDPKYLNIYGLGDYDRRTNTFMDWDDDRVGWPVKHFVKVPDFDKSRII